MTMNTDPPTTRTLFDVATLCARHIEGYQRGLCTPATELERLTDLQPSDEERFAYGMGFETGVAFRERNPVHPDVRFVQGAAAVDWNRGAMAAVELFHGRFGGLETFRRVTVLKRELADRADTPFADGFHALWAASEGLVEQVQEAQCERNQVQEVLHQIRLLLDDAGVPRLLPDGPSTDHAALGDLAWRVAQVLAQRHSGPDPVVRA